MTTVVERPIEAVTPEYRRTLASGTVAIAAVGGVLAAWAVIAMITTSFTIGLGLFVIAAGLAVLDARFATPTRLAIDGRGVTLGFWKRDKTYDAKAVSVTHDVPRGRLALTRRGKTRVIARFRDDDGSAVRALVAAGVEIISR